MAAAGSDRENDPCPNESLATRLKSDRAFWDSMARRDAWFAVLASQEVKDPVQREAFVERTTLEDMRRLGWFIHARSRVLDLGCGVGRLTGAMAPRCHSIIGVDISSVMVGVARQRLSHLPNVLIQESDGSTLSGVSNESVDFVVSLLCLIHVDQRAARSYIREISRVLAPHGRAWLQFQDAGQPEGAKAVATGGRGGFPMVGWSEPAVLKELADANLGVLGVTRSGGFIDFQLCRGSPETERYRLARTLGFAPLVGVPESRAIDVSVRHRFTIDVAVRSSQIESFGAVLALVPEGQGLGGAAWFLAEGTLALPPWSHSEVTFELGGGHPPNIASSQGKVGLLMQRSIPLACKEKATLHVGIFPAGFYWNPDSLTLFPNCAHSISVTVGI